MTTQTIENSAEIARLKKELQTIKCDPLLLRKEFEASPKLQAEFKSFEAFAAFKKAELSGRVKMFDPKNSGLSKMRRAESESAKD